MVDTTCATCGKAIRVNPWRVRKFAASYCSRACSAAARVRVATLTCQHCGAQFHIKPSKKQGARVFCGSACANAAPKRTNPVGQIAVQCSGCGVEIQVWPSKHRLNKHFYCTPACRASHIVGSHNPAYTGGLGRHIKYGENWKRQRRAAKVRDGFCCQYCHKRPRISRHLHVHHIQPFHTFGNDWRTANRIENLITLCHRCHKQAERGAISLQPRLF